MVSIVEVKNALAGYFLKLMIRHPGIMESRPFLAAMRAMPRRMSTTYDRKVVEATPDYELALTKGLSHLRESPHRVLDLGTGTGVAALKLTELFPRAEIEAVDQAPEMLEILAEKLRERGSLNVTTREDDARRLSYPKNRFDLVVTTNAPIYLAEIARILRPSGTVLAAFSFGGSAFSGSRTEIESLLNDVGLDLETLGQAGNGAYLLARKRA